MTVVHTLVVCLCTVCVDAIISLQCAVTSLKTGAKWVMRVGTAVIRMQTNLW